jgi:hypothetical protein
MQLLTRNSKRTESAVFGRENTAKSKRHLRTLWLCYQIMCICIFATYQVLIWCNVLPLGIQCSTQSSKHTMMKRQEYQVFSCMSINNFSWFLPLSFQLMKEQLYLSKYQRKKIKEEFRFPSSRLTWQKEKKTIRIIHLAGEHNRLQPKWWSRDVTPCFSQGNKTLRIIHLYK